ncbi:hypothetical protein H5410_020398 [Solanum commersonii]|uniref:Protein kinase domain-containing protein n=1 Tax=Solanum commersonii TaxID=4109 RepID=A0A9J5Z9X5_SOLCO|nr:hypothetical protein H5410_020398 [Solanum commersonii]
MEKHILLLILLFFIQFSVLFATSNETDQQALLAFQNWTKSPNHFLANNSDQKYFGEMWYVPELRVLNLTNNSLTGMIPPSVGNATKMMNFSSSGNRVSGNIPKDIGNLSQLADLYLTDNQLTGSIPAALFNISSLLSIHLRYNRLSGPLLLDEGNIVPNLKFLSISNNQISGCIPSNICQLTELKWLSLSFNNITGDIPKNIDCLSKILALSKPMAYTETLGTLGYIAPEYGSEGIVSASGDAYSYGIMLMEVLTKRRPTDEDICNENLDLRKWITQSVSGSMMDIVDANLFSEEEQITSKSEMCIASMIELALDCTKKMPESRVTMKEVVKRLNKIKNIFLVLHFGEERHCSEEVLEKSIKCELKLLVICIGNNGIVGQIPPELGKLSNLRQLCFRNNYNLIGQIPEAIFNISSLEVIDFSFNNLSGRIPTTTGLHLPNIKDLHLGILELNNNSLTGTIPNNLGNLHELQILLLHTNQLANEPRQCELLFFNSLADCRMLRYLQVGNNPLNGVLPNSIGNLSYTIQNFYIADAHINGLIPTSIGNMSGLTTLIIEGNNLTGSIPPEIGKLKQLQGLYLTNNKLQGHIPKAVCQLSNLVKLTLQGELSGLIPECLGNLSMLQYLYLGSNKFSSNLWKMSGLLFLKVSQNSLEGEVPSDIGELKVIIALDLSSNYFSGMLPSRLGELLNLQSLDLSNNSFFGQIPLSIANLISLEFLDLSLNALSGLCGVHILEIPACAITYPGKQSKLKEVVLKIATPVVVSSLMIFLLVSIWIMKRQKKGKSKDVEKEEQVTCKSEIGIASMIKLALDCTKEMPVSRIATKEVVKRLNKVKNTFLET